MRLPKTELRADTPVAGRGRAACVSNAVPKSYLARRFLLFAPWADQGLGVHAKTYVHWFRQLGHTVEVYACRPRRVPPGETGQADPKEWPADVPVHRDDRTREEVDPKAVLAVAAARRITDVLLLEVCRRPMFALATALAAAGVAVWAVPNVEMVHRRDLPALRSVAFAGVLCSNQYTLDVLKFLKVPRPLSLPFALPDADAPAAPLHAAGEPVRFLLVGGYNADTRKQATKVAAAFGAARLGQTASLTILCQGTDGPKRTTHPQIEVIRKHMPHAAVLEQFARHHVLVFASRAEGIGIGLHEALRARCAVLALNTPLYRETVQNDVNGWLVPAVIERGDEAARGARAIGNPEPVVHTFTFDIPDMAGAFREVVAAAAEGPGVAARQVASRKAFDLVFAPNRVCKAYAQSLKL